MFLLVGKVETVKRTQSKVSSSCMHSGRGVDVSANSYDSWYIRV